MCEKCGKKHPTQYSDFCKDCEEIEYMGITENQLDVLIKWNNWEIHDLLLEVEQCAEGCTTRAIKKYVEESEIKIIETFKKYGKFTKKDVLRIIYFYWQREIAWEMHEHYKAMGL